MTTETPMRFRSQSLFALLGVRAEGRPVDPRSRRFPIHHFGRRAWLYCGLSDRAHHAASLKDMTSVCGRETKTCCNCWPRKSLARCVHAILRFNES